MLFRSGMDKALDNEDIDHDSAQAIVDAYKPPPGYRVSASDAEYILGMVDNLEWYITKANRKRIIQNLFKHKK